MILAKGGKPICIAGMKSRTKGSAYPLFIQKWMGLMRLFLSPCCKTSGAMQVRIVNLNVHHLARIKHRLSPSVRIGQFWGQQKIEGIIPCS